MADASSADPDVMTDNIGQPRSLIPLFMFGGCQELLLIGVALLSPQFTPSTPTADRPLLTVLGLLVGATFLFLFALRWAVRRPHPGLTPTIIGFGLAFRLTLLWTEPIQEVDIYRYLWDGQVFAAGVNPFSFSPQEVKDQTLDDPRMATLQQQLAQSPTLRTILDRVHYPHVPTVYPPVSQCVFAVSAWLTPRGVSLFTHAWIMKGVLLVFDVGVMALMIGLLRRLSAPTGWLLGYAWCPLVLKEFANSGHLDAIAVFFTVLLLDLLLRGRVPAGVIALVWALATLSKVYPLVLAPVLLGWVARQSTRQAVLIAGIYVTMVASVYVGLTSLQRSAPTTRSPLTGLSVFIQGWQMNDLIFGVVLDNLHPPDQPPRTWAMVLPARCQQVVHRLLETIRGDLDLPLATRHLAFLMTHGLLALAWLGIVARHLWRQQTPTPISLIQGVALSLGWLWYLSATQNPWYWIWVVPFLVGAPRAWLLTAGFALLYYLRFVFEARGGRWLGYEGVNVFHYIIVWLEHAPVLLLLTLESQCVTNRRPAWRSSRDVCSSE